VCNLPIIIKKIEEGTVVSPIYFYLLLYKII